jgi:hypothetical protein
LKKIVIYLVCITIFLQLGFQALLIVTQLIQHKIQIRNSIESGQFDKQLVAFSENEIRQVNWVDDHEFEWQNEKYDVVKKSSLAHGVIYFCINDKLEKKLSADLAQAAQKAKTQQTNAKQVLLFCMSLPIANTIEACHVKHLSFENAFLLAGHCALPFQPPTV